MIGAVVLGAALVRPLPAVSLAIGILVGLYGTSVLVNFRGMQARFREPVGIERRPNRFTPWITGSGYLIFGVGIAVAAVIHL